MSNIISVCIWIQAPTVAYDHQSVSTGLCFPFINASFSLCLCCFAYSCLNVPSALCPSDCAHHPSAPLLPTNLEALGVFPVSWHHHRHIGSGPVRLRGDGRELLLHPQHLAHADRRKRRLPSASPCQTRRESHSPETTERLRIPALCQ